MVLRKAGVRLTLEGQAEYKAGLSNINREQRLLAEQSKLAVAQLGTQASRQQTYTTGMTNYSKQIAVASDKVNVLKNRQSELPKVQTQIKSSLENTNEAYRESQKETERLKNNYDKMREALGGNHEATKAVKEEYEASKAETKELATEIKSLEKAYNANEKELANLPFTLNKAEVATQNLRNEAQKLHEEYRNAGGRYADVVDSLNTLEDKLHTVGGVMQSTGGFLTKSVTAPLLLAGGAAIKASIDFESAFAGTKKTVDELYDSNGNLIISYDDLSNGIREMAKNDLPATTTEIAEVAEAAGQLGIQTDKVLAFSKTMIDMGESTNLASSDAATALARFANITGMSQNQFSNLGSSIVDLGNNFATTESEIVNMALRLAGAGSQIGMSEADILGLSTALSSVGIEAEAGGSAFSKVMVQMQLAAVQGGEDLENFANIAGMSSEDFKNAFEKDAVGAISAFVQGLGNAEEKGTTAIEMLDNMGISEVRLRDALLRAGGASELFGDAIATSNKAFEENVALTEEAEKRYETTESKLRMLKNQVNDVAIEFGGPLVDALRDGIEAATPLIEKLAEMGESFSNLDEDTQRTIIKWGLFAIAGGPVLSMMGNVVSGLGTVSGGFSDLLKWYGKVTTPKTIGDVTGAFGAVAGGATGAAGHVTTFVTAIGGIPGVLAIGGAALLGWTAWKVWGEDAWNSAQRTKDWGIDVGETLGGTLTEIRDFSTQANGNFSLMTQGLGGDVESISTNFASMGEVIEASLINRIAKLDELIANLPETLQATLGAIHEEDKKHAEEALAEIQKNKEKIAEIQEKARTQGREETILDLELIRQYTVASSEAFVKTLGMTQAEQNDLLSAMTGDIELAAQEQAEAWAVSLGKQRATLTDENRKKRIAYEEDLVASKFYTQARIDELMLIWDEGNRATTAGIDNQLAIIAEKFPEIIKEIHFSNGELIDASSYASTAVAVSNQEIIDSATNMSAQIAANAERNAEKLTWMGDEATDWGRKWNGIVLKDGEIQTNVRDVIRDAGKNNEKWNAMRFMLHEADLSSNAKTMIGEAGIVNGYWDRMTWVEKELVLEDEFSITMFKALEDTEKWNELSVEQKTALLYSNTPEVMAQTMFDLGLWDEYEAEIKDLDADNYEVLNAISQSETALKQYNESPVELKTLLANDPSTLTFQESQKALEAFNNLDPELKKLLGENEIIVSKIQTVEDRIRNYNNNINPGPKHLHATSNIPEIVSTAQRAIDRLTGKTVIVDTVHRSIYETGPAAIRAERGLDFHQGGPMIVNDQRGPLFKELVTYPDGTSFIPEGRNVLIPNAPRGAKVLKAALTKNLIPHYENGIGFDTKSLTATSDQPVFNINVNNPVVREDSDIDEIVSRTVSALTQQARLSNLFNKGKEGAYA